LGIIGFFIKKTNNSQTNKPKTINIILKGRITFQANIIRLSYRNRTKVPRIHKINTKIKTIISFIIPEPPKNKIEVKYLIKIIFPYSAINNKANPPAPYSTLNPDTNSDSPSAKSKGVRLVSAKIVTNQTINMFHKKKIKKKMLLKINNLSKRVRPNKN